MRPTQLYLAILGDLVGSRDVEDRSWLQARLRAELQKLAGQAPLLKARAAGPEITAGDEFQVLIHGGSAAAGHAALHYISRLSEELRPVSVRFGLGVGTLTTELREPVRELDGPCFHRARQALRQAARYGEWAEIIGLPSVTHEAGNFILRMVGELRADWTDRQLEVIRVRRTLPLQKDVARQLRVGPSVVSEVLRAAHHDDVLQAQHILASFLNQALRPEEAS